MAPADGRYWFPAKRYGWGIFLGFLALMVAGAVIMLPGRSLAGFIAYVAVLTALFGAICWWKGEPPRWRWGDE
jgi:hypothetical protein